MRKVESKLPFLTKFLTIKTQLNIKSNPVIPVFASKRPESKFKTFIVNRFPPSRE